MKIMAITQARIGSSRFPEKIIKEINGESLLAIHLKRILESKKITKLKVATTTEPDAYKIADICDKLNVDYYKGSINNVLERFYYTAKLYNPDIVVRLTSDCPLIDPNEIDKVIEHAIDKDLDYVSNTLKPTLPDGMDVEVFKYNALEKAFNEAKLASEHEHVTPYIWKNSSFKGKSLFSSDCLMYKEDYSKIRLTVDTEEDFEVIRKLIEIAGTDKPWMEYVKLLQEHPDIKKLNEVYSRNEGYEKSLRNEKE